MKRSSQKQQNKALTLQIEEKPIKQSDEWFLKIEQDFQKLIKQKIDCIESLTRRGGVQRCFEHNIPVSLYCTQCRKIICASCMYNEMLHRRHKVIPIQSSWKEIRFDIQKSISKLDQKTQSFIQLVNTANNNVFQCNRRYDKALTELKVFYDQLLEMIKKSQIRQINYLKEQQEEVNLELKQYTKVMSKIQFYIFQKLSTYGNSHISFEMLGPTKVILDIINNTSNKQWLEIDFARHHFNLDPEKMNSIKNDLKLQLESINRVTIANDIKVMEKKLTTKKIIGNYGLSTPKATTFGLSKQKRSNLSILATPRSIRKKI